MTSPPIRFSALVLLAASRWVQAADEASLDAVVITGTSRAQATAKLPYAITTVDAAALRDAGPMVNLSEALVAVPGLVVNQRQNYAQDLQISARGFGARASFGVRGLRLYTDGIPASGPEGQGQVAHFDLAGAERIEVLRGPFSALYGNSSGGVIALYSAPVRQTRIEAGADVGSHGLRQVRLGMATPLGGGFEFAGNLASMQIDGPRPHGSADRLLANARLGWRGASDRVTLLLSNHDQRAEDPLGLTRQQFDADARQTTAVATQFDTRKTVRQTQAGLSWEHDFEGLGPLASSRLTAWGGSRGVVQYLAIPPATQGNPRHSGGVVDFDRLYSGIDGRLTWRWRAVDLVTGINVETQRDDRRGYENFTGTGAAQQLGVRGALRRDEANIASTHEAYAQGDWRLAPAWTATAGLRAGRVRLAAADRYLANGDDSGNRTYRYATPVVGLRWQATQRMGWHLSASRGTETPTLAELAYRADGSTGFNSALQPQTSRQVELGGKWRGPQGARLDGALFWIGTQDEIGVQTNAGGRAAYQNVGRTKRWGAELEGRLPLGNRWAVQGALNWLSTRYVDGFLTCAATPCTTPTAPVAAGNRIAGTQPFGAWLQLAYRPWADAEGALEWRAMGRTAVNDVNSDFAAGYGVLGLRWRQRWSLGASDQLELLGRMDNLLDQRFAGSVIVGDANGRYFEPAAGRNGLVSLRWIRRQ